jgi:hypothetical protein
VLDAPKLFACADCQMLQSRVLVKGLPGVMKIVTMQMALLLLLLLSCLSAAQRETTGELCVVVWVSVCVCTCMWHGNTVFGGVLGVHT